jgi:hypothetical protein
MAYIHASPTTELFPRQFLEAIRWRVEERSHRTQTFAVLHEPRQE